MKKIDSIKLFVSEHKVGLAVMASVVVTAAACYAVSRTAVNDWNELLKEENLFDKYYNLVD